MKSLERLRDLGFAPAAILDVGAHCGVFAWEARRVFPAARILMIEPLPECAPFLAATVERIGNAEYVTALVGAVMRDVSFFVADASERPMSKTGSSVYRERSDFAMEERKVRQTRLDDVLAGRQAFPFVKLDIQGAELDAIEGYGDMSAVEAFLIEMSLVQYNDGAPLIAEAIAFMAAKGFVLFDIDNRWQRDKRGTLLQIDGVFLRRDAKIRPTGPFWK